ncbi:hypothetical protein V1477_010255 [Vespula maculifrons]|uniref:Uncharacterized protein n=1 Tax=Vespula maculifrons TaxID=7453 RepID=A0ABD2C8W7_VESMC
MKHSFTRALTARKVDFMMIITGERSKSGCRTAFLDDCKAAFSYGCPLRPSGIRIRVYPKKQLTVGAIKQIMKLFEESFCGDW